MKNKIALLLRLIAAIILLQTLYFKFTGAPESKYIFSTLGIEPWGRWFSGMSELIASILFVLGIVVQDDGGTLFGLACTVLVCSLGIIWIRREEIPIWFQRLKNLRPA
jgi:uncharacterized membrane protein YphA (DoxX/SURF4 family)